MLNNVSQSIKDFDKSLRLNPDNPEVLDAKRIVLESSNQVILLFIWFKKNKVTSPRTF